MTTIQIANFRRDLMKELSQSINFHKSALKNKDAYLSIDPFLIGNDREHLLKIEELKREFNKSIEFYERQFKQHN
jgi:hypothetical protein